MTKFGLSKLILGLFGLCLLAPVLASDAGEPNDPSLQQSESWADDGGANLVARMGGEGGKTGNYNTGGSDSIRFCDGWDTATSKVTGSCSDWLDLNNAKSPCQISNRKFIQYEGDGPNVVGCIVAHKSDTCGCYNNKIGIVTGGEKIAPAWLDRHTLSVLGAIGETNGSETPAYSFIPDGCDEVEGKWSIGQCVELVMNHRNGPKHARDAVEEWTA